MIQTASVDLEKVEYFSEPFPHCHSINALDPDLALRILQWMETDAPWELVETDFYEQYEFNLGKVEIPDHLSLLEDGSFVSVVLKRMVSTFNVPLGEDAELVAHKLVPGQSIRIHNDFLEGVETHRLVIQLNTGWMSTSGGLFVIFSSADPEDVYRVITPVHNSAVGFAISSSSHHAISTIHHDARYSLICSFHSKQ